jgi:hypothetical protein
MVLAVAALLLQFQSFQPPVQTLSFAPTAIATAAAGESPIKSVSPAANSADHMDYVSAATDCSSSRMNLASVHFAGIDSLDSEAHLTGQLTTVALDTTSDTQSFSTVRIPTSSSKEDAVKEAMSTPSRNAWIALSIVQHGAAAFDAYSTRQAVGHGAVEDDPLMRPFAHSPAIYVATQVGPVIFDLLARHMQRSEYPLVRRLWWMPQSMSAGLSIFSGVHNLNVAAGKP